MVAGVTDTDADAAPVPIAFVAVTLQLYEVPLVRPVTEMGLAVPLAVFEVPDAMHVTVYLVIVEPPSDEGALNETLAALSLAVAVPIVGAPGAVAELPDEFEDEMPEPLPPHPGIPPRATRRRIAMRVFMT